MFWKALALTGLTAGIGAVIVHHRGKAKVGDTVKFWYRPIATPDTGKFGTGNFGTQAIELVGRVVAKRDPIYGPFYDIQLFSTPKNLGPEVDALLRSLPSTIESVKDKDIIQNLGMMATITGGVAAPGSYT